MPASWRTFTQAARHCSSKPYSRSNSASVSPRMIARIVPNSPFTTILPSYSQKYNGRGDWWISGKRERRAPRLDRWSGSKSAAAGDGAPATEFPSNVEKSIGQRADRRRGLPLNHAMPVAPGAALWAVLRPCGQSDRIHENLERAKGFEPSTPTLARLAEASKISG